MSCSGGGVVAVVADIAVMVVMASGGTCSNSRTGT